MTRRRAIHVCSNCHERKIRCDLDATEERPCSNCREHGFKACTPRTRKPYRSTNRRNKRTGDNLRVSASSSIDTPSSISLVDQARIVASIITQPGPRKTSIYVGETGYGAIWDMLHPESRKHRHITINGTADAVLQAEDLEYLRLKGCFDLPAQSEDLIAAYFQFVHPIFPVIDGHSFLRNYAHSGLNSINLLLIWSMFSTSASYVPQCSGKETRASFVSRGKLLFELSSENDKLVMIQSALLLSFWFDDAEDIKQSWYWTGIAFNIAQAQGLHCITISNVEQSFGTEDELWRNLWSCCILRDAWLSYSMGRPLRLNDSSCGDDLPETIGCRFRGMLISGKNIYSDSEFEGFHRMWRDSVRVAHIVRQSLAANTSRRPVRIHLSDSLENETRGSSLAFSLCAHHLLLCQHAATIATSQLDEEQETAETAADGIVTVLKSYNTENAITNAPLTIVPLVMPAMLISIPALKSMDLSSRERGRRRLFSCLDFLEAIEQTYPAASILKQLFQSIYNNLALSDLQSKDHSSHHQSQGTSI